MSEGLQLVVPLDRGSKIVMTILCHWQREAGWSVRLLHRHSGELAMCPSVDVYSELSGGELGQLLSDVCEGAAGPFELHGGTCTPRRPGATA